MNQLILATIALLSGYVRFYQDFCENILGVTAFTRHIRGEDVHFSIKEVLTQRDLSLKESVSITTDMTSQCYPSVCSLLYSIRRVCRGSECCDETFQPSQGIIFTETSPPSRVLTEIEKMQIQTAFWCTAVLDG